MGHTVGKDIYRDLGHKLDSLNTKVPWNETLYQILKELYSRDEARLVAQMPIGLSTVEDLHRVTAIDTPQLLKTLETLCNKGLVIDLFVNNSYYYTPSPMVIGIFEFTMMRTDQSLDFKKIARLFNTYLSDEAFHAANFSGKKMMALMRTVPYEESVEENPLQEGFVEVLDYEKATAIVENAETHAIGTCSCRHEKLHAGEKVCDVPLDMCSSFGYSADYLIRHQLARKVSKSQMLENVARSKEYGLVLNADSIKKNCQFICHCCKCCCNVLLGVSRYGFPDIVLTSSYIVEIDHSLCIACGKCVNACGVGVIQLISPDQSPEQTSLAVSEEVTPLMEPQSRVKRVKKTIQIDKKFCLGCGVCVVKCPRKALKLVKRKQRILLPENTFEKAILKHIVRGTLQDQLFSNPRRIDQKVLRGVLGGFLRLSPVKRALMSDLFRSRFLNLIRKGAYATGKGWMTEL